MEGSHQIRRIHHQSAVAGSGSFVKDKSHLKKQRLKGAGDPQGTLWAKDTSTIGFTLLKSMGWEQGTGLGTNQEGRTDIITTKHKATSGGLGTSESESALGHMVWSESNDAFASVLSSLNQTYSKNQAKRPASKEVKKKSKAKKASSKKRGRTSDSSSPSSSSSSSSSSDSENSVSEESRPVHVASHIFSRRLNAKLAATSSSDRMSEIMGESTRSSSQAPAVRNEPSDDGDLVIRIQPRDGSPSSTSVSGGSIREAYKRALANTFVLGTTEPYLPDQQSKATSKAK